MPEPALFSLDAEEALLASVLLHDEHAVFAHVEDRDIYHGHVRAFFAAARKLWARGAPTMATYVLHELIGELDDIEYRGASAEVLLMDILARHLADPQSCYGVAMALLVRDYAERRRSVRRARDAVVQAFTGQVVTPLQASGFIDEP